MKKENATQQLIEETLQSLDGISKAEPAPFFYTRLQPKLDNRVSNTNHWSWISKPVFSFATLGLLVILNIAAISANLKKEPGNNRNAANGMQHFAQEYNLDGSSVYNDKTSQ